MLLTLLVCSRAAACFAGVLALLLALRVHMRFCLLCWCACMHLRARRRGRFSCNATGHGCGVCFIWRLCHRNRGIPGERGCRRGRLVGAVRYAVAALCRRVLQQLRTGPSPHGVRWRHICCYAFDACMCSLCIMSWHILAHWPRAVRVACLSDIRGACTRAVKGEIHMRHSAIPFSTPHPDPTPILILIALALIGLARPPPPLRRPRRLAR